MMKSRGKQCSEGVGERGPEKGEAYQLVSWIWLAPGMLEPETGAKLLTGKGFDGGMHDGESLLHVFIVLLLNYK